MKIKGKFEYEICQECACYIANGDTENLSPEQIENIEREIGAYDLFTVGGDEDEEGSSETFFSNQRCETCNALPGNRIIATAIIWEK